MSATAMQITAMTDADVEAVVRLWDEGGLLRPWNDPRADIATARRSGSSEVLVGRLSGHAPAGPNSRPNSIVGSVMVGFDGHRGWLYYLAVARSCRGQGLGRALVREAESWLEQAGAPKVQLMVRTDNACAAGFYRSLGYEP